MQVLRLDHAQQLVICELVARGASCAGEANAALRGAPSHDLGQADERSAADEEDVGGVEL